MNWKQCVIMLGVDNNEQIAENFVRLFVAKGEPQECALFSRCSKDWRYEIYLLTPMAADWADMIGGDWTEAQNVFRHRWHHWVGEADPEAKFGIQVGEGPIMCH